jgi:hypothetical protein
MGKSRREYENHECKRDGCEDQAYKFDYCSSGCANKESWKRRDNPAKRIEVRKKIAEKQMGDKNNMRKKGGHDQEANKKISEAMTGENHPHYGKTGKDHLKYGKLSGLNLQTVEATGHTVRSNWEKEIDLSLHSSELNYRYEPKTFNLTDELTYTPDFIVEDIIMEVKGWPSDISKKRAEIFLEEKPEYTYLVIGNKIPCDIFIAWEDRDILVEKIQEETKDPIKEKKKV